MDLIFKKKLLLLLTIIIMIVSPYRGSFPLEKEVGEFMELHNSDVIKVNFYRLDRKTGKTKEFIGWAELKEGKLIFDVKDARLQKMLSGDFHALIPVERDGKVINKLIIYKVGTIQHLQSVIDHCKDIGCVAEVIQLDKNKEAK